MPGYHRGRPPHNKGEQYPADPPTVEEIVAVMRTISDRADGLRLSDRRHPGARASTARQRPSGAIYVRASIQLLRAVPAKTKAFGRKPAGRAESAGDGKLRTDARVSTAGTEGAALDGFGEDRDRDEPQDS
jgi:hypothetical protein